MTPDPTSPQAGAALPPGSTLIVPAAEVDTALDRIAGDVTADLAGTRPVAMAIMNGGLVFAGQLLTRLPFTLECDYIHVRRYGRMKVGGELEWIAGPHVEVKGRTVLLLDDILDEGRTLAVVREALLARGAAEIHIAAFARKERGEPPAIEADYVGVTVPDRFVFGFGMDVDGAYRNLPAIYALPAG